MRSGSRLARVGRIATVIAIAVAVLVIGGVTAGGPAYAQRGLPTLTTQASGTVVITGTISDSATLSGGIAPTGTITFTVFGPNDPTCAAAPAFTSVVPVAGNGTYGSGTFTPTAAGTYTFVASYSGDLNNGAVTSACGAANESVLVNAATPTLTTQASGTAVITGTISDSATLSGGVAPTGTITFTVFGPNNPTCAGAPAFTSTVPVAGNGTYGSGTFIPAAAGTYTFVASYSGDLNNVAVTSACGAANESVLVNAGTPAIGVLGCANSNLPTDIQFGTQPGLFGGNVVSSGQQNVVTYDGATNVLGQATLSVVAPTAIAGLSTPGLTAVECGAIFQDSDADPNLIDGGTITFALGGFTANGLTIAQILEGGLNTTTTVPCGGFQAGVETCQGATTVTALAPPSGAPCTPLAPPTCLTVATPTPSNIVHVALRQGISFSLIGGISPAITISATYQRLQAYGPFFSLSTNQVTIAITTPTYSMSLTPSPASIPAALGSTIGSTITAALSRATAFQCVSVAGGFSGFVVCGTPGGIVPGTAPLISFVNGAEPGVVTFSTSSGVFGLPGQPTASAQQIASVHCGAAPGTAPVFLVPFVGQPFSFSFSSCQSVSVTLFGGGAAGTAVVTAVYVGDFTGATATAATTVALTVSAPTVSLTRGCNEVITGPTTPAAATATQVLALVSPSSVVVSIWQFNNGLHAFQALYFSTAGAPVDITSVGPNQSIFICVSGAATFTVQ